MFGDRRHVDCRYGRQLDLLASVCTYLNIRVAFILRLITYNWVNESLEEY